MHDLVEFLALFVGLYCGAWVIITIVVALMILWGCY
jgi:hypothetical protein